MNDGENFQVARDRSWVVRIGVAIATIVLKSVLAPTGEILFFAPPKKSIQKKGGPDAACSLRSSGLNGVA